MYMEKVTMFLFLPYGLWNSQPSTNLNKAGKNTQLNNQIDLKYFVVSVL